MNERADIDDPLPETPHEMAPETAQVQTQSACNGGCTICPYPRYSQSLPQGRMPWTLIERVLDQLVSIPSIRAFSPMLQNEPLLDARLEKVIDYIKSLRSDLIVGIATNGSLLDSSRLESLMSSGLNSLIFSLNAVTRETFESLQPRLSFDVVMANLDHLIRNKPDDLYVRVKAMVVRENLVEIVSPNMFGDVIRRLKEANIPFGFDAISNRAGAVENYDSIVTLKQTQGSKKRLYCHDPFETVNILFNGDVIACCADWSRSSVLGNLETQELSEIWQSDLAKRRREAILEGDYDHMAPCQDCSQAWNIKENLERRRGSEG